MWLVGHDTSRSILLNLKLLAQENRASRIECVERFNWMQSGFNDKIKRMFGLSKSCDENATKRRAKKERKNLQTIKNNGAMRQRKKKI